MNHSEVGGFLQDFWGIPYQSVECALFHHDPLHPAVMDLKAVGAVHIADYFAWKAVDIRLAQGLEERVFTLLAIDPRECERVLVDNLQA